MRWEDERHRLGVIPDQVFGLHDPAQNREAFFFLEVDRGSMPATRTNLRQTSFLRKLLTYAETREAGIPQRRYNMPNFRVLTVTTSRERAESFIAAHQEYTRSRCPAGMLLFTDWKTLAGADPLSVGWRNGRGEETQIV